MSDELDDALREAAERWAAPERHGLPPADRARAHRLPPEPFPWSPVPDVFRTVPTTSTRYPVDPAPPGWDMDRDRHLWVGEWKDPEPPAAGREEG